MNKVWGHIFWRKLNVILHCLFQPVCNISSECQCHLSSSAFDFLGCYPIENVTCPAIDSLRILFDCYRFCICSLNETSQDEFTFHCLKTFNFGCLVTFPLPPKHSTSTTSTTTMPPATPLPPLEDECAAYYNDI